MSDSTEKPTAIADLASGLRLAAEKLDELDGSIKGIRAGIGDMHSGISTDVEKLSTLVSGLAADVRTALSVVPSLRKRIDRIEHHLELPEEPPSNGAATPQ